MLSIHTARCLFLFLAALGMSGCAVIGTPQAELPEANPQGVCQVEIKAAGRKAKSEVVTLTPETRAQDIVEQTGADKKFRRMEIAIERPTGRMPGEKIRLVANYDRKEDTVTWNTDYAILPGDTVYITEDNSTMLDDVLDKVVPPIFNE